MEDDPKALRAQAARWRKEAFRHDKVMARALIEAAQSLDDRAAAIETAPAKTDGTSS